MPLPVFDNKTGQAISSDLSPEQLTQGLIDGSLGLDKTGAPITLIGKNGTAYKASPDQVPNALATGAYRLQSPHEQLKQEVIQQEQQKGALGSLEAGASSFANQALFGVPGAFRGFETPEEQERDAIRDEYHQTARLLGGAGGIAASLLYGGELFKGVELAGQAAEHAIVPAAEVAEASLASRIASKAVNVASQGALLSSPQAVVQAIAGDPKKAAETMFLGAGVGALLGGFSGAAGKGIDSLADLLTSKVEGPVAEGESSLGRAWSPQVQNFLDNQSTNTTLKVAGAERSALKPLSEDWKNDLADFMHSEGLIQPGDSKLDIGQALSGIHDKYGKQIGDLIDTADSLLKKGTETQDLTQVAFKPGQLSDLILNKFFDDPEMGPFLHMSSNAPQAQAIQQIAEDASKLPTTMVNGQEVILPSTVHKFAQMLRAKWVGAINKDLNQGGARGLEVVSPLDKAKGDIYGIVNQALNQKVDQVFAEAGSPAQVGQLSAARLAYAKINSLEKFARILQDQAAGNRLVGLTDFLHMGQGPFSSALQAAGAAAGAVIGGPGGALAGHYIAKPIGTVGDLLAKHWVENKGLVYLSSALRKAAKEGPEVFSAVWASDADSRLAQTLKQVPQTLRRMSSKEAPELENIDPFQHLLGINTSKGMTSDQKNEALTDRLTSLVGNPQALAQTVGHLSSPLDTVSPPLADAFRQQMMLGAQYLFNSLPKPNAPPPLFSPNLWAPTPQQQLDFKDRAEIMVNPFAALKHIHDHTLSDAHMDALTTLYPSIYNEMRKEILQFAAKHSDVKFNLDDRAALSKFMGAPTEPIFQPQNLVQLQASYQAPKPNDQTPALARSHFKGGTSLQTPGQKTMGEDDSA